MESRSIVRTDTTSAAPVADSRRRAYSIDVMGGFEVRREDDVVDLPSSTQRLVALLALNRGCHTRTRVGAILHGERDEARTLANLRMTLFRVRQFAPALIDSSTNGLRLNPAVHVDLDRLATLARALDDAGSTDTSAVDPAQFCHELLPGWYDDFVDIHREIVRQMCLHALENLSRALLRQRHVAQALHVALTAVSQSPLRETSHQLVIEIHLAEGNVGEARRQFETLTRLLWDELRVRPSDAVRSALLGRGVL